MRTHRGCLPNFFVLRTKPKLRNRTQHQHNPTHLQFGIQPYTGPLKYGAIAGWLTMAGLQLGCVPALLLLLLLLAAVWWWWVGAVAAGAGHDGGPTAWGACLLRAYSLAGLLRRKLLLGTVQPSSRGAMPPHA